MSHTRAPLHLALTPKSPQLLPAVLDDASSTCAAGRARTRRQNNAIHLLSRATHVRHLDAKVAVAIHDPLQGVQARVVLRDELPRLRVGDEPHRLPPTIDRTRHGHLQGIALEDAVAEAMDVLPLRWVCERLGAEFRLDLNSNASMHSSVS